MPTEREIEREREREGVREKERGITLGLFFLLRCSQRRRQLRGDADDQGHRLLFGIGRLAAAGGL